MKNNMYTKSKVSIKELDFLNLQCPTFNETRIKEVDIILAADGKLLFLYLMEGQYANYKLLIIQSFYSYLR